MFDLDSSAAATRRELEGTRAVLDRLDDAAWQLPVRCTGWRIVDLVAHLVAAAGGQAEGLRAAPYGGGALPRLDPPVSDDTGVLQKLLAEAGTELLDAMAALSPDATDSIIPLPFGPVPGVLALQIVPIEYGFHHNDLLDAIGQERSLPGDVASSLVGILPGLLPALSGGSAVGGAGSTPSEPCAYRLSTPDQIVDISFDGTAWSPVPADRPCTISGDTSAIALFAMGRIDATSPQLTVDDVAAARRFKEWFPGP